MDPHAIGKLVVTLAVFLLLAPFGGVRSASGPTSRPVASLLDQIDQLEREGRWEKACLVYEQALLADRNLPGLREGYRKCLRRLHLVRRHADIGYRQQLTYLSLDRAFELYEEVLTRIQASFVIREKVGWSRLLGEGRREMDWALEDEKFLRFFLPTASREAIRDFRARLRETSRKPVHGFAEARVQVREVAGWAQKQLGLNACVVVLEFACGACNSLDEYSGFLTPAELRALNASIEGQAVGVGLELTERDDGSVVVGQVLAGSPAARAGLRRGEPVLRVDGISTRGMTALAVSEILARGEINSSVELVVGGLVGGSPRTVSLERELLFHPSVIDVQIVEEGIGYFRLNGFQKSTSLELDDAMIRLRTSGMKVLVLDLRGNAGGLFQAGVDIAERFLPDGLIVQTQGPGKATRRRIAANAGSQAFDVPLVVLIDAGTSSAAEVLAGALKENHRAVLVGSTTFGKGSAQTIFALRTAGAGLRVTNAFFFSPNGNAYSGNGITPHVSVDRLAGEAALEVGEEHQVRAARHEARRLREMLN